MSQAPVSLYLLVLLAKDPSASFSHDLAYRRFPHLHDGMYRHLTMFLVQFYSTQLPCHVEHLDRHFH